MMDFHRRRLVGLEALATATRVLDERSEAAASTGDGAVPTNTVAPYHSALNGVNQPMNMLFKDVLWWTLGVMALIILCIRLAEILWSKLRQVSAMSAAGEKQAYWKIAQWHWMPSLKKHLTYAPLWNKRHNREIKLSSAVNVGTLPSRLHTLLLGIYLLSNVIFMFVLNWANDNKYALCAELRGRSGTLALVNMVPLIIMAGRNNPLISLLKISFDTYNLLHRWLGRLVVIETVIHAVAWLIVQLADGGWEVVSDKVLHNMFIGSGMVGTIALMLLLILSVSPVRHAFYETFLNTHIILAFIVFVCTWIHCGSPEALGTLPQLPWIMAIFALWFAERMARMLRLAYVNWSDKGLSEAMVEVMPGECTRVTVHLPRYLDVQPGTHAYLRFGSVNPWECHPFSIAWVEHKNTRKSDSLPTTEKAPLVVDRKNTITSVSFVIGAQTGMTRKLYDAAVKSKLESKLPAMRVRAAIEGPYAGHHSLDSYGHAVLFAGSTGITHQISYIRHLINGFNDGTVATRKVTLVWIVRDYESLEWVRPWMDTILRMPHRKDILRIQLFITRPKNPREIVSASSTVQMFPGRPNVSLLLKKEVADQVGAMCVTVCGPGALADDVRAAVRQVQDESAVVDFVEESFTW